ADLARLQERLGEGSRRKDTLSNEQVALQSGLEQAETELRAQEVAIATCEGEFNALQDSRRVLHQKIDTVVYELQSLAAQEQEGSQKRAALSAQASELEMDERQQQQQLERLNAAVESLRQQRDTANGALT